MVDWAAIASVVASASVAIAVTLFSARNERKRYERQLLDERERYERQLLDERKRYERQLLDERRNELRQLLDSSVQHLFNGYDILYSIDVELGHERAEREVSTERLRQLGEQLSGETIQIAAHGLRVGLRLPAGASLAQKQTEVNRIFLKYDFEYDHYLSTDPMDESALPPPPHEKAFEGIQDLRTEIRAYLGVIPPLELPARTREVGRV